MIRERNRNVEKDTEHRGNFISGIPEKTDANLPDEILSPFLPFFPSLFVVSRRDTLDVHIYTINKITRENSVDRARLTRHRGNYCRCISRVEIVYLEFNILRCIFTFANFIGHAHDRVRNET